MQYHARGLCRVTRISPYLSASEWPGRGGANGQAACLAGRPGSSETVGTGDGPSISLLGCLSIFCILGLYDTVRFWMAL